MEDKFFDIMSQMIDCMDQEISTLTSEVEELERQIAQYESMDIVKHEQAMPQNNVDVYALYGEIIIGVSEIMSVIRNTESEGDALRELLGTENIRISEIAGQITATATAYRSLKYDTTSAYILITGFLRYGADGSRSLIKLEAKLQLAYTINEYNAAIDSVYSEAMSRYSELTNISFSAYEGQTYDPGEFRTEMEKAIGYIADSEFFYNKYVRNNVTYLIDTLWTYWRWYGE